jgi:hypothetical protein
LFGKEAAVRRVRAHSVEKSGGQIACVVEQHLHVDVLRLPRNSVQVRAWRAEVYANLPGRASREEGSGRRALRALRNCSFGKAACSSWNVSVSSLSCLARVNGESGLGEAALSHVERHQDHVQALQRKLLCQRLADACESSQCSARVLRVSQGGGFLPLEAPVTSAHVAPYCAREGDAGELSEQQADGGWRAFFFKFCVGRRATSTCGSRYNRKMTATT